MASIAGTVSVETVTPRTSLSGRSVATGGILPGILWLFYKYGLVTHWQWPEMPELEPLLPGLAVAITAFMHHTAQRTRERRDRLFLLELVRSGVVIPIPPNSPVVEVPPSQAPTSASA